MDYKRQQVEIHNFLELTLNNEKPINQSGETIHFSWKWIEQGILQLTPQPRDGVIDRSIILSAGIHGNETAPVEILQEIIELLFSNKIKLHCQLLVIFGNIPALQENKRYIHSDMNRMFGGRWKKFQESDETKRAALLEECLREFCNNNNNSNELWHLDMHTAIRGSHHVRFGVLPVRINPWDPQFVNWLGAAGLEALVHHQSPGGSFTHFSCEHFNALSCTLELGKALPFTKNDLTQFYITKQAIIKLISGDVSSDSSNIKKPPLIYRVVQQITRTSQQFKLHMSPDTLNFTLFPKGQKIAENDDVYVNAEEGEYILFPNPSVALGLRAGLMLVKES